MNTTTAAVGQLDLSESPAARLRGERYFWGGLLLIISQPLRLVIGMTPAWLGFAKWMTS
jgi:hypothetical protein